MKLKDLSSIDISAITQKRVLVRVDYNLPTIFVKEKKRLDDFKVKMSLPTIEYLLKHKAKVILMSHFGDPWKELKNKELKDIEVLKEEFSLRPVVEYLELALNKGVQSVESAEGDAQQFNRNYLIEPVESSVQPFNRVKFIDDCLGDKTMAEIEQMNGGEIALLENLRFHLGEEKNEEGFAFRLSQLGDFYVNDAFAVSHKKHSSIDLLPKYLPSAAGFLLIKEMQAISSIIDKPRRPVVVVLGGAKIEIKIDLIKRFLKIADYVLIGGMLANEILRAKKMMAGKATVEIDPLILKSKKIVLPQDMAVLEKRENEDGQEEERFKIKTLEQIHTTDLVLDIGPESQKIFKEKIALAKTIFWNGPLGMIEKEFFVNGTKEIALAIARSNCISIIGGGETSSFVVQNNLQGKFSHISTGGGAMLDFLAQGKTIKSKIKTRQQTLFIKNNE